ncbi:MAG: hypothetical protein F4Z52_00920 [Gammaproteobacteria bacterium]|nr:hypothetical protein [Gammaproteobacteria bacterium]MXX15818.1 hypothetical protein [Gammaproteobacteria bacterium]
MTVRWARLFWLLPGLLMVCGRAGAFESTELVIPRSQWPEYVNSSSIAELPQVRQVLRQFDEGGRFRIIVRYPGGAANARWAGELIGWFIAHGVPGQYINRELGTGDPDSLLLLLVTGN